MNPYHALDHWVDRHFADEVQDLQALVRIPTDTPPGDNAPHAAYTEQWLRRFGWDVETHPVSSAEVQAAGLQSVTNLIVRRRYGPGGCTLALNAHGDVVPPGEGWQHDPYGADIEQGHLYGRAAAVSKSDFATYVYAVRALEAVARPTQGCVELHFTYDEEMGGQLGPGWLLQQGLTRPDAVIAAGFSYHVVTAHNGCLQMEVSVRGSMTHAALPDTGTDALQGAVHILQALYRLNDRYPQQHSTTPGIDHPSLNIGFLHAGTHTNVVPGHAVFRLDRRMIPEENPAQVETELRQAIEAAAQNYAPPWGGRVLEVDVRRLLLAHALKPQPGQHRLVQALQRHGQTVFGCDIPDTGTPLYTDARLYAEHGIPSVLYGAGPRSVAESHAKRADERLALNDLRRATQVVARTLHDLLSTPL